MSTGQKPKPIDPNKPQIWHVPWISQGFPMYLDGELIHEGDFVSAELEGLWAIEPFGDLVPIYLVRANGTRIETNWKWTIDKNGDAAVACESVKE